MGKYNAIVSDMKDTARNTFVEMAHSLAGSEGAKINVVELRDFAMLFQLGGEVEIAQKERGRLEIPKMWLV